jgi:hypothetical protein
VTFQVPTIAWRGQLALLRAQVQHERPEQGERAGTLKCVCGATFHFQIQSTGLSRGFCTAACGVRWHE